MNWDALRAKVSGNVRSEIAIAFAEASHGLGHEDGLLAAAELCLAVVDELKSESPASAAILSAMALILNQEAAKKEAAIMKAFGESLEAITRNETVH